MGPYCRSWTNPPKLLSTRADDKVEHVAGLIQAVCRLAAEEEYSKTRLPHISSGIGKLLGPSGGIEKWGWKLLDVLELVEPSLTVLPESSAMLMLENDPHASALVPFPCLEFKYISSSSAKNALESMFRSLGSASEESCLFSVEWFISVYRSRRGSSSVTAAWCACRLLEGVSNFSFSAGLTGDAAVHQRSKRLTKLARSVAKIISELWDEKDHDIFPSTASEVSDEQSDSNLLVQHVRGLSLHETLRISTKPPTKTHKRDGCTTHLHRVLSLHLLAITAGVLHSQFSPLLLYALYPVLQSLSSSEPFLSSTAFATLHFISHATSYASPANLLLSNFDYALDAISRRLARRWLDIDATKVMASVIRLVGSGIVDRAGDVIEECFDRLDEFHGYQVLVEGLIEVLSEVVNVIKEEHTMTSGECSTSPEASDMAHSLGDFLHWVDHRHGQSSEEINETQYAQTSSGNENAEDGGDEGSAVHDTSTNDEPTPTPAEALTKQIVGRSLYFLTHRSPTIRARILSLLGSSASIVSESAFLPSLHSAWPFILNRLSDSETFVLSAAASLVQDLVTHFGSFMFRRVWDDVWPRIHRLLGVLDAADATSALARRGYGAVGTESAYTHSHRLYRSFMQIMTAVAKDVHLHDVSAWEVLLDYRRFLHKDTHEELQDCARRLYIAMGRTNPDAVWLVLFSTMTDGEHKMKFLRTSRWDITLNASLVFRAIGVEPRA